MDPIEAIEKRARAVALEAIDKGWEGPPFDPIKLAETLRIPISGNADVRDAKTVPFGKNKIRIEFNPNRPRGRVRFSIAHEIAHSFFQDCAEKTRYRDNNTESDDWQLELLCNIAAAELIMPIGSFVSDVEDKLDIEQLLELRSKYDVSLEAVLIRAAKLTDKPCNIFCASRIETVANKGRYQIDYLIASRSSYPIIPRGTLLPKGTVLGECTAIGFASSGSETWSKKSPDMMLECVGLPPYPGHSFPRVAGIIYTKSPKPKKKSDITYITGDALNPRTKGNKIIAHIVNDRTANWGGRGFAASVKNRYPGIQNTFRSWAHTAGDKFSLGNTQFIRESDELIFAQMIAQKGYGPSTNPRIRYSALEGCFIELAQQAIDNAASVHMPRIGSGYGGGSWKIIEEIIIENLIRAGIEVTIYTQPKQNSNHGQAALFR
ncbi:MAG: ImmA/IrrE family metallo-endopeptidase [Candidatus Thiodiazotropha lotti]|nr:ImmA/IrrE family metallo-endopeptidase [Candidatus Thiodiazotropha lotti]